jgi:hypothetical protein
MKTILILLILTVGCSGTVQDSPQRCKPNRDYLRALACEACYSTALRASAIDPCAPGTITAACDSTACGENACETGGGPVSCRGGSLFYGPGDRQCQCVPGDKCLAVPINGEPSEGVCL